MPTIPWQSAPTTGAYQAAYPHTSPLASFLGGALEGGLTMAQLIAKHRKERRREEEQRRQFEARLEETKRGRMATETLRGEIITGRTEERKRERQWKEEQAKEKREHEIKMAKILHGYKTLEKKAKDVEKMEKEELKKKWNRILTRGIKRYKGRPELLEEYIESYYEVFPEMRDIGRIPSRYLKPKRLTPGEKATVKTTAYESITPATKKEMIYPGELGAEWKYRTMKGEEKLLGRKEPEKFTPKEQSYLESVAPTAPTEQELALLTRQQRMAYDALIQRGNDPRTTYDDLRSAIPKHLDELMIKLGIK